MHAKHSSVLSATTRTEQRQGMSADKFFGNTCCSCVQECRCAQLMKQHALNPFAMPAGLAPTVQCCTLALLYCSALETTHSLMLSPQLMSHLWPLCEQVQ